MLIGHERQREAFLAAMDGGRMHHAWLLGGARGIGKRRFADWAALKLLADARGLDDVPDDDPAARLVAAGSHPDYRVLTPPTEGKGAATAAITIDEVRERMEFLHSHPSIAKWRVMIVDSIDDMNLNAANAFLKMLEEPRPNTVYLLVSHAPGRLLPTIRSRCLLVPFERLPEAETERVLALALPDEPAQRITALARMAHGAPGAVLELGQADIGEIEQWIERLLRGEGAVDFARGFGAQTAIPRLKALLLLAPRRIAMAARRLPQPALFDLYDEADALAGDAIRLAYDRVQVAMALADILARAGRIESGTI